MMQFKYRLPYENVHLGKTLAAKKAIAHIYPGGRTKDEYIKVYDDTDGKALTYSHERGN